MFAGVFPKETKAVLKKIAPLIRKLKFYLAGGGGLSLQFGHRISEDLDLFCLNPFNSSSLLSSLKRELPSLEEILEEENTVVVIAEGVKLSFFYYSVPLLFEPLEFEGIEVADWRDIVAEKFKTISQRGSKKDFYDLFEVFYSERLSIKEAVKILKRRFQDTGINLYHVLKSLTYFEDAELEPEPVYIKEPPTQWSKIKEFFTQNIEGFSEEILKDI
ncbi:MAG: nucleotidyl transferase AbiEii/AbiGii toxin family protein [Patescibacteria group bacterium]|nr:nucleotidyl transferase AbiEii/AbiGii toxin family protein [Patescibacteria group bacterium]